MSLTQNNPQNLSLYHSISLSSTKSSKMLVAHSSLDSTSSGAGAPVPVLYFSPTILDHRISFPHELSCTLYVFCDVRKDISKP